MIKYRSLKLILRMSLTPCAGARQELYSPDVVGKLFEGTLSPKRLRRRPGGGQAGASPRQRAPGSSRRGSLLALFLGRGMRIDAHQPGPRPERGGLLYRGHEQVLVREALPKAFWARICAR